MSGCTATATEQSEDQRNHEQHQEYEEEDLRDFRRTGSDAGKAEYRGDQRDDKKDYRIVQHGQAFLLVAEQQLAIEHQATLCRSIVAALTNY